MKWLITYNKYIIMEDSNNLDLALVMCPGWGVTQPPVGISYLKGFLKNFGIKVKCFDLSLELYKASSQKEYWNLNYPEYFITPELFSRYILPTLGPFINTWAEEILSYEPQVVGFSLFMSSINVSLVLAQQLKKMQPNLTIVGGGAEVTRIKRVLVDGIRGFAPIDKEAVTDSVFDLLIDGEGEESLLEVLLLMKQKRDFHSVEGSLYAHNSKIVANRARKLIDNLDILPPPDFLDFDLKRYTRRALPLVTSRGCINRCTFCADSPLWKIYRCRSPEKVLEEIKILVTQYRRNEFEIADSTFNGDIGRLEKICDLIIESKLDIYWSAKVTLRKEMDYKLLQKMEKAGCTSLGYGVESGSPKVLKDMQKNIDLSETKRIIKDTWRAGIEVNCFFIIGYPTEAEEDFQLTLDFIQENAKYIYRFTQITGCHIEEDSYLGHNVDEYGIVFKEDGWHSKESTPGIREKRLLRFKKLAVNLHRHYECEVQL